MPVVARPRFGCKKAGTRHCISRGLTLCWGMQYPLAKGDIMSEQHPHLPHKFDNHTKSDGEKVYDAEVIHEEYRHEERTSYGNGSQEQRGFHGTTWSWTSMRGGMGGMGGFDAASRYAPAITVFLLIVVLVRFGFLAGLGFLFFYAIGAAFGTLQLIRRIAEGKAASPWLWRIANWTISFLLAGWLSGGFR